MLFHLQGTLRGYDQATNLILDDAVERVYSTKVSNMRTTLYAMVSIHAAQR